MKILLFLMEIIVILSFLKMHYNISIKDILHDQISFDSDQTLYTDTLNEPRYSSYYSEDIIGNDVLRLDDLSEERKLAIWKNTSTKDEVINCFPNIELMKSVFNNKIEDNGKFKKYFLDYMEEQHSKYIIGELSSKEFKESILNPSSSLTSTW